MKIGVISDTHDHLDPKVPALLTGVDHILHAGDIGLPWLILQLENIAPVKPGGDPSLEPMFAAQGNYTLLDNHELGNAQFQSGGAPAGEPAGAGVLAADTANDVNRSCDFINRTPGFAAPPYTFV